LKNEIEKNADIDGYGNRIAVGSSALHRRRVAGLTAPILLFALGLLNEPEDFLGPKHTSWVRYMEVYSSFLLLLVYIVPFFLFMRWFCKKYTVSGLELLLAGFCGAFIASPYAGDLNDDFTRIMTRLLGHYYSDAWMGSFEVGIVEELLKLGTTALVLYVLGRKSLKSFLGIGMCVGMGFQIDEDISDITESGFRHVNEIIPIAVDRIQVALGSHWCYAAVTAAGLYFMVTAMGDRKRRRKGIGLIILIMSDHFVYDTPIGDVNLFNALLTAAVLVPLVLILRSSEMSPEERI